MSAAVRVAVCAVVAGFAVGVSAQTLSIVRTIPGIWHEIDPTKGGTGTKLSTLRLDLVESFGPTTVGNLLFPAGSTVMVGNNGGAGWSGAPVLDVPSEPIPSAKAFAMGRSLLPYWADIGNDTGGVYWSETQVPGMLIIEWSDRHLEGKATTVRFQIQVPSTKEDIYAQFIYDDIQGEDALGGLGASIGYQDGIGGAFNDVQWSFDQPFSVENGMVLTLIPAPGVLPVLAGAWCAVRRRRR